jgi:hypothetical protein
MKICIRSVGKWQLFCFSSSPESFCGSLTVVDEIQSDDADEGKRNPESTLGADSLLA